jgi:hypothetical protein
VPSSRESTFQTEDHLFYLLMNKSTTCSEVLDFHANIVRITQRGAQMISTQMVCKMAQSLDGVTEKDHHGSDAFVANGRIFATVWHDRNEVNLMLNRDQQRKFLEIDGEGFVEIDNAWGRAGATKVQLSFVDRKEFADALKAAWQNSAVKRAKLVSSKPKAAKKKTRK